MEQGELQANLLRDALHQATLGYHCHQFGLPLLVGQFNPLAQHHCQHKLVIEYPRAFQRTAWHQIVVEHGLSGRSLLCSRLRLVGEVYIERYSMLVILHVGVYTHVYRPVHQRFECIDGDIELGIVGLTRRMIQRQMESLDILLTLGHASTIIRQQLSSADNLHREARSTQESHQRLGQTTCLVAQGYSLIVV